jgi:hypothetical protein
MSFYQSLDLADVGGDMLKAHYDQLLFNARFLLERDGRAAVQQLGLAAASPLAIGLALTDITPADNLPQNIYEPVNWFILASAEVQLQAGVNGTAVFSIATTNTTPLGAANGSGIYSAGNSERYRGQFVTCAKMVTVAAGLVGTFKMQGILTAGVVGNIVAWRGSVMAIRIG